jgi:hypothetical protein
VTDSDQPGANQDAAWGTAPVRLELLRELIQRTGQARIRARGTSMAPTFWPGDELILELIPGQIFAGDIVAFARDDRLFVHRVIAVKSTTLITQGDYLTLADPPVEQTEVLGVVTAVWQRGKSRRISRRRSLAARAMRWLSHLSDKPLNALLRLKGVREG